MAIVMADSAKSDMNVGHGHVTPRPDGVRMRCGGPNICAVCSLEAARKNSADRAKLFNIDFQPHANN